MTTLSKLAITLAAIGALGGCATTGSGDAPAAPQQSTQQGPQPGMDANGNVTDSRLVESGSGRTVQGINDYEGEIVGNPAPNSKFNQLQIGMPVNQVVDIAGEPSDQGVYATGKVWIPLYFGIDRHRHELVYEKTGRLIFSGKGYDSALIWIIHNRNEGRYR